MNPLLLFAGLGLLAALLILFAQHKAADDGAAHHNPYPSGVMLAVNFAHADHVEQACVACHHNFIDDTGQGLCFDCHKTDPEVADLIETQFHDLCRGCHVDEALQGNAYGPTRRCIDCHVMDDRP